MENPTKQIYTLQPARFFLVIFIFLIMSLGLIFAAWKLHITDPMVLTIMGAIFILLFGTGVVALGYRVLHPENVLVLTDDGIYVNCIGIGRLSFVPWDNVLYAKYYACSVEQMALGVALKDEEVWIKTLYLPEKGLAKLESMVGNTVINIRQNLTREYLGNSLEIFHEHVEFDDEMIYRIEHPQKKKNNSIA